MINFFFISENMDEDIKKIPKLIFGKYRLIKKIGEGSFGKVYLGVNEKSMEPVAIKLEPKSHSLNLLKSEALYLFMLKGVGIPRLIAFGTNKSHSILIETLLGDSLSRKMKEYNNKLPLKDSLMIAIQVIERLEFIHSKYLIHRDIKPANLLIGYDDPYIIYLIDFGLCKKYRSSRTGKHVKFKVLKYYNGTSTYASVNALKGYEVSRRDDFESAAYMIINLMQGFLPWELIKGKTKLERFRKIYEMKLLYDPEELCKNLPKEIMIFLLYSKSLDFEQEPDYKYCYSLFNNALIKSGFSNDLMFSWIKDPKIKNKLNSMRDKKSRNLEAVKRKVSPQARLFRSLLNSFEAKKPKQMITSNILDSLNNSKEKEISINSYRPTMNQTANNSSKNASINDYDSNAKRILRPKLSNHKNYRKIFIQPILARNNFSGNELPVNNSSKLSKPNTINQKVKAKRKIQIPIIKLSQKFTSIGKKRENVLPKNDHRIKINKKNSVNNNILNPANNIDFNNKNDLSSNKTLNVGTSNRKGNTNFIKIIQNNIINSDINMIINYPNKKDTKRNNKNILLKNINQKRTIDLNYLSHKSSLNKTQHKKIFEKKGGLVSKKNHNLIKGNNMNYKTLNSFATIDNQNNEPSKKNSLNSFEYYYSKYIKGNNKIKINSDTNSNNTSDLQKSKSIRKDNLSLNQHSLLKQNNNTNSNKITSDIKNSNRNQKYKKVLKIKNNVIVKTKTHDYYPTNNNFKYNSNTINKNNQYKIENLSLIYKSKDNNFVGKKPEVHSRTLNNSLKHVKKIDNFV